MALYPQCIASDSNIKGPEKKHFKEFVLILISLFLCLWERSCFVSFFLSFAFVFLALQCRSVRVEKLTTMKLSLVRFCLPLMCPQVYLCLVFTHLFSLYSVVFEDLFRAPPSTGCNFQYYSERKKQTAIQTRYSYTVKNKSKAKKIPSESSTPPKLFSQTLKYKFQTMNLKTKRQNV